MSLSQRPRRLKCNRPSTPVAGSFVSHVREKCMKIPFLVRGIIVAIALAVVAASVSLGQGGRQQLGNSDQLEKEWKKIKFEFQQQAIGQKAPDPVVLDT